MEFRLGQDTVLLNVDALCQRDMLDERVYAAVVMLCTTGKVDAVIGGPACGTNSFLREKGVMMPGMVDLGPLGVESTRGAEATRYR